MNNIIGQRKVNLDLENLLILYKHYKEFLLPVGVIIASIIVIFYVVFPQIQQYFSSQDLVKAEQQKLDVLKSNYSLLTTLDDATTASNLNTLSLALPPQKDFAGIIDAISYVSSKTGVSVGNFEFSLGDLSSTNFGGTAYPSTKIDISLKGSPQGIAAFAHEIIRTMPVAEVTAVNIVGDTGSLTVLFYYKPYPSQNVSDAIQIAPLSVNQLTLLKQVSSWNSVGQLDLSATTNNAVATNSAVSSSPF